MMAIQCEKCGTWYDVGDYPFCRGGHGKPTLVLEDDSIPGGMVIENLTPQPKRYYSRSEIKRQMDLVGAKPFVRHVGEPGSDKSKFTSRWV